MNGPILLSTDAGTWYFKQAVGAVVSAYFNGHAAVAAYSIALFAKVESM